MMWSGCGPIFRCWRNRFIGRPLVYLDTAASAQKPRAVIDAMSHLYEHDYANVHRGVHTLSQRSTLAFEAARETAARFINAGSSDEIILTRGATEAINLIASQLWPHLPESRG